MNNEQNVNTLLKLKMILIEEKVMLKQYPDNCSLGKIAPFPPPPLPLGLGFRSRLELVLGLGGNQTIAPEGNCPLVTVRVLIRVSFGIRGQFSSRAMF